jgi:2-C-methyl-D-erythritol 2,4-cyclodiphosphate synthase
LIRVGVGYDVHALVFGRKLMLGCVEIPFDRGLDGHSDADVIVHALCDALLGAAGSGDIGLHFPDNLVQWKGASGASLLEKTMDIVRAEGWELGNADLILLAQHPKIKNHRRKMIENMAAAMSVTPDRLNLKATTTEGLGFIGREEGLAAHAVVLLMRHE